MAHVSRRWQRRISTVSIALGLIVYAADAKAAPVTDKLMRELAAVAGEPFKLDCTYAGKSAHAVAYPRYKRLAPIVYVRPNVCNAANAYVRTGRVTHMIGLALLVLVHEAQHVSGVTGEGDAECRALALVGEVAERLVVGTGQAVRESALVWHAWIVARHAEYACPS